ncbi:dTDP-glucose 4,6-dehydratase [Tsukamurella paurometabola]|uniref:NAD-dependent epimerase/dehydratase n=1 Tax=Tsukamurella paurometabola (strain ATCC 8368 / DSM 20162 / CCUG 35730 / CIP 100753 / JCM 10117 / KCTC 9821 / NBRC 16120 / NCIMB 702349 / NCTC 13040) TaxID=521096 RepID=D5UX45_TSUPD|nr:NAD-dependent epimerase/dehydratase [Tsukamurella paurometabola DSM 20162]SUP38265.1 dTDP-glucose 4,6-dehydratase [Tsukamurella paurometabola]
MHVIGRGFIAGHLRRLENRHTTATVLAAGVSSIAGGYREQFARERRLVLDSIEACRREDRRLVLLSTASHAMYGNTSQPARETDAVVRDSAYGLHKQDLEHVVADSAIPFLILRLSHVMGAGQRPHQLLPALIEQIRGGQVRVQPHAHRDVIDVQDVVTAIDGLLTAGVADDVVNVASGNPVPVPDIVRGIAQRMGTEPLVDVQDAPPTRTVVSVAKLHAAVPVLTHTTRVDYLDRILDKYVPA